MKAIWNNTIIAESSETIVIEGNHYFPRNTIKSSYFKESATHTVCHWKGEASYFTLLVDGVENVDAAWFYDEPKSMAASIKGYVAFWKGVKVVE